MKRKILAIAEKFSLTVALAVVLWLMVFPSSAKAYLIGTTDCASSISCTGPELAGGASLQIGNLSFSSWSFSLDPSADLSDVLVSVAGISKLKIGNTAGTWRAEAGEFRTSFIDFRVQTIGGPPIVGNTLELAYFSIMGNGTIDIIEFAENEFGNPVASKSVFAGPGTISFPLDQRTFDKREDVLLVFVDLILTGGDLLFSGPDLAVMSSAQLDAFTVGFSVPEPSVLLLLGSGLVGLGLWRRRNLFREADC